MSKRVGLLMSFWRYYGEKDKYSNTFGLQRTWIETTVMPTHLQISILPSMKERKFSSSPVGSNGRSWSHDRNKVYEKWYAHRVKSAKHSYESRSIYDLHKYNQLTFSQWWSKATNAIKPASSKMSKTVSIVY